jgi:hypothetical protein
MSKDQFIHQVDQINWIQFKGPEYYRSDSIVTSLTKLVNLKSEDEKWNTYNDVLSTVGNNHAETYYPVIIEVLPLVITLLKSSQNELVRNCILEILSEWYYSFGPELGTFTLKTKDECEYFVRTHIKQLITDNKWNDSERNIKLISDFNDFFNEEDLNPLLGLKFDHVCMYDYKPTSNINNRLIADNEGMLVPAENIKKIIQLDSLTIYKLTHLLGSSKSYGDDIMRCFIPHLAFVYFLDKKIVFHVSICLTCNNLQPSIDIPAHSTGRGGMTKSLRDFLNDLLDKHEFSNNVRLDTDQDVL